MTFFNPRVSTFCFFYENAEMWKDRDEMFVLLLLGDNLIEPNILSIDTERLKRSLS